MSNGSHSHGGAGMPGIGLEGGIDLDFACVVSIEMIIDMQCVGNCEQKGRVGG